MRVDVHVKRSDMHVERSSRAADGFSIYSLASISGYQTSHQRLWQPAAAIRLRNGGDDQASELSQSINEV